MAKEEKRESNGSGEGGSFWTSYSDLLLGLSVIFLVLFFFATIRAGLEQMKHSVAQKQTQEYLKGKIPDSLVEKNKQQQNELAKSVEDLEQKKQLIDKTAQEMTQMIHQLSQNQNLVQEVIKDQQEKTAVIESVKEKNEKLELQAAELEKAKIQMEQEIQARAQKLADLSAQIQNLSDTKQNLQEHIQTLSDAAKKKDETLAQKEQMITELDQKFKTQSEQIEQSNAQIETQRIENQKLAAQSKMIQDALAKKEAALNQKTQALTEMQEELNSAKKQEMALAHENENLKAENAKNLHQLGGDLKVAQAKLQQQEAKFAQLHGQNSGMRSKISELESLIAQEKGANRSLASQNAELQTKNSGLLSRADSQKMEMGALAGERDRLRGELKTASHQLSQAGREIDKLQQGLSDRDAAIGGLKQGINDRDASIGSLKGRLNEKNREFAELERGYADAKRGLGKLDQALKNEQGRSQDCMTQLAALKNEDLGKAQKLAQLDNQLKKANSEIKTLAAQRRSIASDIQSGLRQQGVAAQVNPESGMLTLEMDEAFQFKNGSAELTDRAKAKLKQMIPVYAENLFGKKGGTSRITSVSIVGHASPRYRQKFIDPETADRVARRYNEKLSAERAKQIAEFIFGDEIGNYPYKYDLKLKTQTAGRGFNAPITAKAGQISEEPCGKFDCAKSRRVEISFEMKEDPVPARLPAQEKAVSPTEIKSNTTSPVQPVTQMTTHSTAEQPGHVDIQLPSVNYRTPAQEQPRLNGPYKVPNIPPEENKL